MVVAYRRPSVDFFTNCYGELYEAHARGPTVTPALYRTARPEIERWLLSYWCYRWPRIRCVTVEDLIQEGFECVAKYMKKYNFVCSNCGSEHKTELSYDTHCETEHGYRLTPNVLLSTYLSLNAMGRMRNIMRDLLNDRRGLLITSADLDLCSFQDSRLDPFRLALSAQRISRFRERAEREQNRKIREYLLTLIELPETDWACEKLADMGFYSSPKSVREAMRANMSKAKRSREYRSILEG